MNLPKDPNMLLSIINMKLRDEYADLNELCASMDIDKESLLNTLSSAGYEYNPVTNSFN
ncbi:MAG: DUF4250 domain-containing protein [Muribaculaceae bacterium]|nr:DUF4250 domain-containing protein [Muribaculaceae bacterium]